MSRIMSTATNAMTAAQIKLDTIANNMSNVDTVGFKRKEATFQELLVQNFTNMPNGNDNRLTPDGIRVGSGARIGATLTDFRAGAPKPTGRPLDVALTSNKQMFEVVELTDGVQQRRFTRDGNFQIAK
ncbi:MAG: flagellar hook-basal body complex protein, partial [Bacilli bacterium]